MAGGAATPVGGLEVDFEQSLDSRAYSWYVAPLTDIGEELKIATGPSFSFELARYMNNKWSLPPWFQRWIKGDKQ